MPSRRILLIGAIASCLPAPPARAADLSGPTPYPKRDEDWPGVGAVRLFDWMPEHRRAFWTERRVKQGSVVFAGDSLTEGWEKIEDDLKTLRVANRGIGGEVSRGLLFRFKEDVLDLHPRAIVLLIGTNDLTASQPAAETLANLRAMLTQWRTQAPNATLLLCTVPSSANPKAPIDRSQLLLLNSEIRKLPSEYPGLRVVDLYAATVDKAGLPERRYFDGDRLHLSRDGYQRWKETLTPVLIHAGLR